MNKTLRALTLLFFSFFFFQCQKEVSYYGGGDIIPETTTPDPITATVQGNILDENDQPAQSVTITVGAKTATTNAAGYFRIAGASLDKKTALVVAEKAGYFKGVRSFSATSGTNQVVLKLIKKALAGTVSASSGGSASLPNGTVVTLPANGIIKESSGVDYSGAVNVYAAYIDPTSSDIGARVPGSFAATDKDGKRTILTSYGMLAVELESSAGEKLQIKSGSTASLTTPIPSAGLSSAPATIPMWYVDEQTGLWKEEGTATKQGNVYVGDVKHFSFWNCDVSNNAVIISLKVVSAKNLPLVHVPVRITRTGNLRNLSATMGYTDSLGKVSGYVPGGETLLVEVLDPCGNVVYSQNVAALSQSTDIGVVTMPSSSTAVLSITGKLVNCSGAPVTNGFAIISFNNTVRYATTDAAGNFESSFILCAGSNTTGQVIGVDQSNQQQSQASTISITAPATNVGNIITCGTSSVQFINYSVDGTNYSITSVTGDSLMARLSGQGPATNLNISGFRMGNNGITNSISFGVVNPTGVGSFPLSFVSAQMYSGVPTPAANATFTSFAQAVGEFYEGSFSAGIRDSSGTATRTIITTFRVRRTN